MKISILVVACLAMLALGSLCHSQENASAQPIHTFRHGFLSFSIEGTICTVRNSLTGELVSQKALGKPAPGELPPVATNYKFETLAAPPEADSSSANAISNGQIAGSYYVPVDLRLETERGAVFSDNEYQALSYPGAVWTSLDGINAEGTIVGEYLTRPNTFVYKGLIYKNGKFSSVQVHNSAVTALAGINDTGAIVGNYRTPSYQTVVGFLLANGTVSEIDFPNSTYTDAAGINNAGEVVGTYGAEGLFSVYFGFTYLNGAYTNFQVPGTSVTIAQAISNNGVIVGEYVDAAYNQHGFVLNNGQFATIDYPGANSTTVLGIDDSGKIVGEYYGPACPLGSQQCAFMATPE